MSLQKRIYLLFAFCLSFNVVAWISLACISKFSFSLLSLGALAYFFGLRHAFDADHIAAIDNVTRKLRQDNKKSVGVGLFFSLGHSTVVILLSLAIVFILKSIPSNMEILKNVGGLIGATVSASFLTLIGIINFFILKSLYKLYKSHKEGKIDNDIMHKTTEDLLNKRGLIGRFFSSTYKKIDKSYKMYPVGFLFGLGFDTATEIAILGMSAALANKLPIWEILIFPLLFTAGMSLMDSIDGLVMMKIYDWAMIDATRKLFFNMVITATSVFMALVVGAIEWLQVISIKAAIDTPFFNFLNNLNFEVLGIVVVIIMVASWLSAFIYYKKVLTIKI